LSHRDIYFVPTAQYPPVHRKYPEDLLEEIRTEARLIPDQVKESAFVRYFIDRYEEVKAESKDLLKYSLESNEELERLYLGTPREDLQFHLIKLEMKYRVKAGLVKFDKSERDLTREAVSECVNRARKQFAEKDWIIYWQHAREVVDSLWPNLSPEKRQKKIASITASYRRKLPRQMKHASQNPRKK